MREDYPIISQTCKGESLDDCELARLLKLSEPYGNTCRFPGDLYYQAIMLRCATMIEFEESIALYNASKSASIATGSRALPFPVYRQGFYGQLLLELERNHPTNLSDIFV
jgi:hypothetical protein